MEKILKRIRHLQNLKRGRKYLLEKDGKMGSDIACCGSTNVEEEQRKAVSVTSRTVLPNSNSSSSIASTDSDSDENQFSWLCRGSPLTSLLLNLKKNFPKEFLIHSFIEDRKEIRFQSVQVRQIQDKPKKVTYSYTFKGEDMKEGGGVPNGKGEMVICEENDLTTPICIIKGEWKDGVLKTGIEKTEKYTYEGDYGTKGPQRSSCFEGPNGKLTFNNDPKEVSNKMKSQVASYVGAWKMGKITGKGTIEYTDGFTYTGNVFNGDRHGKGILSNNKDGEEERYYDGEWNRDEPEGKGTMEWVKGRYEGGFKEGRFEGHGVYVGRNENGEKYDGHWSQGHRCGKGTFLYSEGDKYVGDWEDGLQCGIGTCTYSNGNKYYGSWKQGKFCGKGTLTKKESGEVYVGDWKDHVKHGRGQLTKLNGETYDGGWKYGKKNGKGVMVCENGDKEVGETYDGGWKYGKKNGKGVMVCENGDKEVGEWKNGKKDGIFDLTYKDTPEKNGTYLFERDINEGIYEKDEP